MERGKKLCNELKAIRKQIADANGIEYSPNECTHQGDCKGTCPKCEAEMRYIENELNMRRILGKAIVVAGLGLSVASCSCSSSSNETAGDITEVDTIHELQGDVADTICFNRDDDDSLELEMLEMGEVQSNIHDEVYHIDGK